MEETKIYGSNDPAVDVDVELTIASDVDPILERYQTADMQATWCKELEASRKVRQKFNATADKTLKRFSDERSELESDRQYYNVFFANTEIKMSALYARTPTPDIKRRFSDADDDVSRVAASILQRNICYELDHAHFDDSFRQILFDRLVPGVGIGWARLDEDLGEPEYAPMINPATGLPEIDFETGQPLLEPVGGSEIKDQLAAIDYVPWNDFLWAPCRLWSQCRWVARRFDLSKDDVEARFGDTAPELVLRDLSYTEGKSNKGDKSADKTSTSCDTVTKTTSVFEIWDKERGLVWWIAEAVEVPLDVQEDRMSFPDFFPTPLPPLGRFSTNDTIPISDYKLVQDQYNELDTLNDRASKKLMAVKSNFVYDASRSELVDLMNAPDGIGIPLKDWTALREEKGGINNTFEFVDYSQMVKDYMILIEAREKVKAQIFEIEGISDIMRGASQQYDTATATSAKASLGSTRLAVMMKDVADYIARLLQLKAHMICTFYQPERVLERAGSVPATDEQYVQPALQLLASNPLNHYRLSVSTDSLQLPNWNQEKAERSEAIQAITAMMGQILPAAEQNPLLATFGAQLMKFGIAGFKGAGQLESALDAFVDQSLAEQRNKSGQPPQPSPAEIKAKQQEQAAQLELQKTQIREQSNTQVAQIQAEAKRQTATMQAQVDVQKNALREQEIAFNAQISQLKLQLQSAELQVKAQRAEHENALDIKKLVEE